MKLKEEYRAICKEYARQTGKIIGFAPQFFLRDRQSISTCLFGDNYFLNMEEMQQIVDHMDMWLHRYGTVEKVGERVVSWMDYTTEKDDDTINLWQWMTEMVKPGSNQEELLRLNAQLRVLEDVAGTYSHHSLDNVIKQIKSRVKEILEQAKDSGSGGEVIISNEQIEKLKSSAKITPVEIVTITGAGFQENMENFLKSLKQRMKGE